MSKYGHLLYEIVSSPTCNSNTIFYGPSRRLKIGCLHILHFSAIASSSTYLVPIVLVYNGHVIDQQSHMHVLRSLSTVNSITRCDGLLMFVWSAHGQITQYIPMGASPKKIFGQIVCRKILTSVLSIDLDCNESELFCYCTCVRRFSLLGLQSRQSTVKIICD